MVISDQIMSPFRFARDEAAEKLYAKEGEMKRLIAEVRKRFFEHFNANKELYDEQDCQKVLNKDYYIERYLLYKKKNVKEALEMLKKCFQWRKSSGLLERKDSDFPKEFFAAGGLFEYAPDKQGRPTLYMRIKLINKIPQLEKVLKEFIAYKISQLDDKCAKLKSWALIFDCSDIGFNNVHLDLLRYLIHIMVNYFTWGLKYIISLEVPWILNAVQKVVFAMLPDEAKKVVTFRTKKDITELIDPANLPPYLDGTCSLEYNSIPAGCKSLEETGPSLYQLNQKQIAHLKKLYPNLVSTS